MKAVVCTKYGTPDVLQVREVGKPVPKDNEVLIKIYATSVDSGDVRLRSFTFPAWFWLPGRMMFGITKPRNPILGSLLAGEIEAVGKDVKRFNVGDFVFGSAGYSNGAYAEYKCLAEEGTLVPKPVNATFEEAAAVPFGGFTALHFLRKANVQSGQHILVNGASGSVGTAAVQLAKHFGAEVTGVCGPTNLDLVKSLGADHVIDYTKEDFAENGQTYDVVFDAVDKTSFSRCRSSLKQAGFYLTVGFGPRILLQMLWTSVIGSKTIVAGVASDRLEDLVFLKELAEAGKFKPVVDKSYPMERIAEAHEYVEKGHKKGNVVVTFSHDGPVSVQRGRS